MPKPATDSATTEPTTESTPHANEPVEEVMGPDLGPEETGTHPMYTGHRDPWANYSNIKSGLLLDIELDVVLAGQAVTGQIALGGTTDIGPNGVEEARLSSE
ncbi:hypothetical protein PM082_023523 [Marasmius tenuissimus]|nr:hypothetical protein PM082_023523 [Marasmius tenuissimus]